MFLIGYRATQAQCLISTSSFVYLAYTTYSLPNPSLFRLYVTTAIIIPAIVPYTLTIQRALNAALNMRAEQLVGPGTGTPAEMLGKGEARTLRMERERSTEELVRMWGEYNATRVVIGIVGALVGTWTALEHASSVWFTSC
jgi:Domain of unknown function (DUF1772)